MKISTKINLTVLFGLASTAVIAFGTRALLTHENSPGNVGFIPASWPIESAIQLATDRSTLVMFAHPQCPCTRASISELAQVMAHVRNKVRAYVLFYTPRQSESDWRDSSSRREAGQIPGVTVLPDMDGAEAARFGAETSGHSFLFDPSGRLIFNGGITASRGHVGNNAGANAIVSLINNQVNTRTNTFVFGCSIAGRKQSESKLSCLK